MQFIWPVTPIKQAVNIIGVNELLLEFTPVTGLAASFGLVPTKSEFKKSAAADNFLKKAKAAAFRLRCPPAVEAKSFALKRD